MATQKVTPLPSFPQFTITSEEISRYAELTSLLTQLEKQKDHLRDIVRETLTIARECRGVLARSSISQNHLLVDLVASLAVAHVRKAGAR